MHPIRYSIALAAGMAGFHQEAVAGYGRLDPSFHQKGWSTSPAGGAGAMEMAWSGGKLIVTGNSLTSEGKPRVAVWRFYPDGSRDTAFNGTGEYIFPSLPTEFGSSARHVAVRPNGKILLAATAATATDYSGKAFAQGHFIQLLADGGLDESFGAGGKGYDTSPGFFEPDQFWVSPAGSVFTGGIGYGLVRYDLDAERGFDLTDLPNSSDYTLISMDGQVDGKLVCLQIPNVGGVPSTLVRVKGDGSHDKTFGAPSGRVTLQSPVPGVTAWGEKVKVLTDGKILVIGRQFTPEAHQGPMVARYLSDGTLDPAFGTAGTGISLIPLADLQMQVVSVHVLSDGRIILVGNVGDPAPDTDHDIVLVGLTPTGSLDPNFGTAGVIREDFGPYRENASSSVMLSDRELMLSGGFYPGGEPASHDLLFARYRVAPFLTLEDEAGVELAADPAGSLDFGPVTSASKVMELKVKYDGVETLTGPQVSLSGESHPGDFSVGEVVPFAGGEGSVVVRFTPSGYGQRTATLTIAGTGTASRTLVVQLSGHKATPLESWRMTWFGSPDNSGAGADTADFDGDGLPNFMEYATAGNPHQPTASVCTVVRESGKTGFTFTRPAGAGGEFSWLPETAVDPAGPWSGDGLAAAVQGEAAGVETVKVLPTAADTGARRFFRLRVTKLP